MIVWARENFRDGASLILLKVVKRRVRNYSSETRFLNWGKSLDRAAASSINGATPPIAAGASRCDRFAGKTFVFQPKVAVSSGLPPVVPCENSKLTKMRYWIWIRASSACVLWQFIIDVKTSQLKRNKNVPNENLFSGGCLTVYDIFDICITIFRDYKNYLLKMKTHFFVIKSLFL